ncbi:unnamed protein product [Symbiodinium sp. CCMP2592]|nr:unnamed protein product [Symbiodinium sp. CCMP2592]
MAQPKDDDYHTMELSRRSIQISDLQEELDGGRDRQRQAEDRSAVLERQMEKLKVEISVRKSKTQEMDDQVAADEAACVQSQRLLREAAEAAQAELSRIQEELAVAQAAVAQAEAQAEAQRAAEAAEEEDRRRLTEEAAQAQQLEAAQEAARASQADVEKTKADLRDLEAALNVDKQGTKELTESVAEAEEKRDAARAECERLATVLEALSSKGELHRLREAVASKQAEQQRLTQELANQKRETAFQRMSIQGRLDETQRMMKDHLSETQRQLAGTRENLAASPLCSLMSSLKEARSQAEALSAKRLEMEAQAKELEKEVSDLQGSRKLDPSAVEQEHHESLQKDLCADFMLLHWKRAHVRNMPTWTRNAILSVWAYLTLTAPIKQQLRHPVTNRFTVGRRKTAAINI